MNHLVSEFLAHYHAERPHQGLENELIVKPTPPKAKKKREAKRAVWVDDLREPARSCARRRNRGRWVCRDDGTLRRGCSNKGKTPVLLADKADCLLPQSMRRCEIGRGVGRCLTSSLFASVSRMPADGAATSRCFR